MIPLSLNESNVSLIIHVMSIEAHSNRHGYICHSHKHLGRYQSPIDSKLSSDIRDTGSFTASIFVVEDETSKTIFKRRKASGYFISCLFRFALIALN